MQVIFNLKLVLECWDLEILENIKLIFLCKTVPEIWLVLIENLVISNLELQYRGIPYILKKICHNSETISHSKINFIFSKNSKSQHSRTSFISNFICIFLSFLASQKKPFHIDTPCMCVSHYIKEKTQITMASLSLSVLLWPSDEFQGWKVHKRCKKSGIKASA